MRRLLLILALCATPVLAQDSDQRPGFFSRLFGTDSAETDTEQGTRLERLIESSLSGEGRSVTVTGFRGALAGEAKLDSLTIADADGVWLTLTDATLDWSRAALLRGALSITELSAREILLPRLATPVEANAPSPEASGGFQLPELPVSIEIGRIAAERVEIGEAVFGLAADLSLEGSLSLSGGNGDADLAITRLDRPGEITLDAGYQNATEQLRIDLTMQEEDGGIIATLAGLPGAPSVDFSVSGDAPLSEFAADIRLATDGVERLQGQVTLGQTEDARRILANIGGDIAPVFAPEYRDFFGNRLALELETLLYEDGRVSIPAFSLSARELDLGGTVEIGADKLPSRIDITGRIAPESGDTVLLPLAGDPTQVASAELAIAFDAAQSDDWQARIAVDALNRDQISARTLGLNARGRIVPGAAPQIAGDIAFDVTGLATTEGLSEALGPDLAGRATIDWAGGPVTIERFELAGQDLSASGDAEIDGNTIRANAALFLDRIANFSTLAGRPLSGRATLEASGQFNPLTQAFQVSARGNTTDLTVNDERADAILAGEARLDLSAIRDTDGLRVSLETLESPAANLNGFANLQSGGSELALEGRLQNTAIVLPGVTGPSDITFAGREDENRDWTIDTTLASPALTAKVSGFLSNIYDLPAFQGNVTAESSDLSVLSEVAGRPLAGSIRLTAEGGGNADLTRALIDAKVTGQDISIGEPDLDRLLRGKIDLALRGARTEDRIDIEALSLQGEALVAELVGALTNLEDNPSFEGRVTAESADLSVFSGLAGRPLAGQLTLNAQGTANADLSDARIDATANGDNLSVGIAEADRILQGPVSLTLRAGRSGNRIDIETVDFSSASLTAETSGQLGGEGDELELRARLANIAPFVSGFDGPATVDGTVSRTGETLTLNLDATGPGGTRAAIAGTVEQDFSTADLGIDGTAPLGLANRFIAPRSLAGTAQFDLRLSGRPALESLSGQVRLSGGRLADPGLGTALEDITGTIGLAGAQATLAIETRVQSGGRITVSGPIGLSGGNSAALRIDLVNVRATDPQLYETIANGQVRIDGPLAGGAAITGTIELGETNIRIPSSGLGGTGAIPEITHLRERPPSRDTRRKAGLMNRGSGANGGGGPVYSLDIRISAPNRIFVRGRGLDSEFGGRFRITGTTANVIPIGAFELIRGRLDILGRRLALETARITIQGGFIPYLNIRATTDAEDTQVNVEVIGPADNPEIRFTSSPELPQEEVLARLIFGRGLETLSPLQAARLALAVRTLAGQGGEGVVGNIRRGAGLADLDVTTNEAGNTAVRAGAYLGENIYSDVTVDSAGETQLNLNLDVTRSLTVRGGVSNDGTSSLGIFFERDY